MYVVYSNSEQCKTDLYNADTSAICTREMQIFEYVHCGLALFSFIKIESRKTDTPC